MPTSREHYERVLSAVYSWMQGGVASALERNRAFFGRHDVRPRSSGIAVDLGAGSGFQSIPLVELGFDVTAIDLDAGLLAELESNAGGLAIRTIADDLARFRDHCPDGIELIACMTDTILHLDSRAAVTALFADVHAALEPQGRVLLTFRDLTRELAELERFIPVRSDDETIFTCFLEYEPATVKVHDLVYRKQDGGWRLAKSFYRKLRLAPGWIEDELRRAGFDDVTTGSEHGLYTVVATKTRRRSVPPT